MKIEKKQADVLCVGGGVVGLMAAIRARELGAKKVIVAEKSNTLRSGAAGVGCDHFSCYIPEVHGDFETYWKARASGQMGPRMAMMGKERVRYWFENSFDIVKLWESWGIPMKYQGKWEFAGHAFPGQMPQSLKYSGQNQKPILTKQAIKRGVDIINRVMIFHLLRDGEDGIIGAIGIDTREDKVIEFEAKSVILGTGRCVNLYPSATPGLDCNRGMPLTLTGDGRAMAYRAGAEIVNIELTARHAGPKYFIRGGIGTWVGVVRDRYDKPVGPFLTKPDRRYSDMTVELKKTIFDEYTKSGQGPLYMDCRGASEEDIDYMLHWLRHEGYLAFLDYLEEEGIDLSKTAVEWMTTEMDIFGGILSNYKGETLVKGLYAAGDEIAAGISAAAVIGWSAGENAAKYSRESNARSTERVRLETEAKKDFLAEIRTREVGAKWKEAHLALQQIMNDYAGIVRSESLLGAGLNALRRLKDKARTSLMAENQHELMHCLEVLNLMDIGELVFITANERKETRGQHVRSEYSFSNPQLNDKLHIIQKVDDKPVTEWRDAN